MKFNVIAVFAIIIFSFALTPITFQNDTYYTIEIGRHIVETKQIDMQDPFSWHEDLPYTYPHWAYDVGTYLIYQLGENIGIGGFTAVYILTVILSITLGLVIYAACVKISKNNIVSFLITMGVMYLLKDFIAARAQLVTFILFALTILFIEQFLATKKKRYVVGLIIIPILIANLHVAVWPFYFVLYLPYIAQYIMSLIFQSTLFYRLRIKIKKHKLSKLEKNRTDEIIKNGNIKTEEDNNVAIEEVNNDKIEKINNNGTEKLDKIKAKNKLTIQEKIQQLTKEINKINERHEISLERAKNRRENPYKIILEKQSAVKWLILIMIICIFTGLLTPLGDTPYTYLIKTTEGNTMNSISEHQPLTLINNTGMIISIIGILAILIFTDTKIRLSDLLMISGLLVLAFMARRQVSMFDIIGGIVFARIIASFFAKYDVGGQEKMMKAINTIYGKIITILLVILISLVIYKPKVNDKFVSESSYPVQASDYIINNMDLSTMKIYNEYNYGSYLLFRGIPVFMDSRADLYTPQFNGVRNAEGKYDGKDIFSDYINISSIGTYHEDQFDKYDITHVLCRKNAKLNMFLSRDTDNYKLLYSDDNFVFYERKAD